MQIIRFVEESVLVTVVGWWSEGVREEEDSEMSVRVTVLGMWK